MKSFKEYLAEAKDHAVEHHFEQAVADGKMVKTAELHPHVGKDFVGVRAWQGPSGHFYTSTHNLTPHHGFKEEHTDLAHTALDASRDKNAKGNHSGHNYGRAFKGGMIRVRQTPTHLYIETLSKPTVQQVNALAAHAKHAEITLIDHRNQYQVYDGSRHEHKEGNTGTYLSNVRRALSEPKPDTTLDEAAHYIKTYGDWGLLTKKGMVSGIGGKHTTHLNLRRNLGLSKKDSVEYAHEVNGNDERVILRSHDRDGATIALKHFHKLPKMRNGTVSLQHLDSDDAYSDFSEGTPNQIYRKLQRISKRS